MLEKEVQVKAGRDRSEAKTTAVMRRLDATEKALQDLASFNPQ